jgi:hypothetical protein
MDVSEHIKQTKTAEELEAMILEDLIKVDGGRQCDCLRHPLECDAYVRCRSRAGP